MKKIVKKNYEILVGIVIGIIISTTVTYGAENILTGSDVSYNNTSSHGSKNNIQGAIDELYEKANSCSKTLEGTNNKCQVISGTGKDIGDEVQCGTEPFYVVKNTDTEIILFAKYNLEVGYDVTLHDGSFYYTKITNSSGLQSSSCTSTTSKYKCTINNTNLERCTDNNKLYKCDTDIYNDAIDSYKNYLTSTVGLSNIKVYIPDYTTLNLAGCTFNEKINSETDQFYLINGSCNKSWLYNQGYTLRAIPAINLTYAEPYKAPVPREPAPVPWTITNDGKFSLQTYFNFQNLNDSYYGGVRAVVEINK